jgi:hypothetical protein
MNPPDRYQDRAHNLRARQHVRAARRRGRIPGVPAIFMRDERACFCMRGGQPGGIRSGGGVSFTASRVKRYRRVRQSAIGIVDAAKNKTPRGRGVLKSSCGLATRLPESSAASPNATDAGASAVPSPRSGECARASRRTACRLLRACGRCSSRCRSACAAPSPRAA